MSDPVSFPNTTPYLGLPLLIPGQAQKEFFVNHALAILDALQARVVNASLAIPPASAGDGDCFRITTGAELAWDGRVDQIAVRTGDDWHFIVPREGMSILDDAAGQMLVFRNGWERADAPPLPSGGSTIDVEARAAIMGLIQSLQTVGVLGAPAE